MPSASQHQNPLRIIGIGNPLAGDDAVGICVINKLKNLQLPGVDFLIAGQAPLDILGYLEGVELAILVDAVQSGQESGTIVRLDIPKDLAQLTSFAWTSGTPSTHMFGLREALLLGTELKTIPLPIILYGIEVGQIEMGEHLSLKVSQALEKVAKRIIEDIKNFSAKRLN